MRGVLPIISVCIPFDRMMTCLHPESDCRGLSWLPQVQPLEPCASGSASHLDVLASKFNEQLVADSLAEQFERAKQYVEKHKDDFKGKIKTLQVGARANALNLADWQVACMRCWCDFRCNRRHAITSGIRHWCWGMSWFSIHPLCAGHLLAY